MSLPDNLKNEAIEKYGRKFLFIYPKHETTLEDLYCGGESGKRTNGYYGVCTACGCKYDYTDPLPGETNRIRVGYGCGVVEELQKEAKEMKFTECECCGATVEKKKGWYGKKGLKDRFYLQAWEVHDPEHVTLHEAIIALDDWDRYREYNGARCQTVYDLRTTELTPGLSETWKWDGSKPMRVANVCGWGEKTGCTITHGCRCMTDRACYMGFEKLSGTFLRPFLEACEKDPGLMLDDYAAYIIRMNEEPMTEILFKFGYKELVRERVNKTRPTHGNVHMDFSARSPKKFFRGLKKNSAAQKMTQLMRIIYPRNVTEFSLETAAKRFRTSNDKPEDLRLIVEAGSDNTFFRIWELLPTFSSRRIGEYIDSQKETIGTHAYYYRDYLEAAQACGAPLNEAKTAFPKNLMQAHDEMIDKREYIKNEKERKKFIKRRKQLVADGFEYRHGDIFAVVPKEPQDIVIEGRNLHHCVGGYVKRVTAGESNIIFIRRRDNKSWFTLEIDPKTLKYKQCYGDHNRVTGLFESGRYGCGYDPEVGKFLYHYRRHLTWAANNKHTGGKKNNGKHDTQHGAA